MLKSRFSLKKPDEEELGEAEQEHEENDAAEEHVEETSEVQKFIERVLDPSEMSQRVSMLGKTAEGDGYTYLKISLTGMNLTNITAIKRFKHLQFVDVSNNNLDLEALQAVTELPFLVLVHADHNALLSAALKKMKYLQVIIMNNNKISSVHDVFQPELSTLEVGYNMIHKIHFTTPMPNIRVLDFRYNFIDEISELNFPNLHSLYLAGNKISLLDWLERLVNLKILHLRNNPIRLLNGFEGLTKLQYINLRNCKVATLKQVKKLKVLPALETLILKGCPYMGGTGEEQKEDAQEEEDPEIRVEVLATLQRLKRINKGVVTPDERSEAKDLMLQWLEDGEKDDEEVEDENHEEISNPDD